MSNTAGVPVLSSFAQAKARYEGTMPIRGNKDKVRPLGYRRYHSMASIEMPDADTVVLKCYGQPFVTWKSDDSFTITNSVYQSAYTAQHLSFFLPRVWYTRWNATRMTVTKNGKAWLMPYGSVFHFAKVGDDYELVNKPVAHAIRKKRGADRKLLKKCVPFFDWLTVVLSVDSRITNEDGSDAQDALRKQSGLKSTDWYREQWVSIVQRRTGPDNTQTEEHQRFQNDYRMSDSVPTATPYYRRPLSFNTVSCEKLMQWVEGDNAENWVLAMNLLGERAGKRTWREDYRYDLSVGQAIAYVLEVARHVNRDTVFFNEQLPDGVVPSRNNSHYMNTHVFSS
jgi:hypothetical protein